MREPSNEEIADAIWPENMFRATPRGVTRWTYEQELAIQRVREVYQRAARRPEEAIARFEKAVHDAALTHLRGVSLTASERSEIVYNLRKEIDFWGIAEPMKAPNR